MSILLDSDIVISLLRGRPREEAACAERLSRNEALYYSPITKAEVFAGMRRKEEAATRGLFSLLICLPVSDEIGETAGYYVAAYGRSHGVEIADALIAATAREHHTPLWTLNKKHYPMPDVTLIEG